MNICKSKIVTVPETGSHWVIRIDLVKARLFDGKLAWVDAYGTAHVCNSQVKKGTARYIVSIADAYGKPPKMDSHGGLNKLVTASRIQANAAYEAWCDFARRKAQAEQDVDTTPMVCPSHTHFWHL